MSAGIAPAAKIRSRLLETFVARMRDISPQLAQPLDHNILCRNLNYLVPEEGAFYNNGKISANYAATFVQDFVHANRVQSTIEDVTTGLIRDGIIEEPNSEIGREHPMVYRARVWGGMMEDELATQRAYRSRLDALMSAIHDIYGLKLTNSKRQEALIKCVIDALGYGGVRGYELDLSSGDYFEFLRFGVEGASRFFEKPGQAKEKEEKGFLWKLLRDIVPTRQLVDDQQKGIYSWHQNGKFKLFHIQMRKGWEYTDPERYVQDEALNGVGNVDEMMFLVLGDERAGKVRVYQIDNWNKDGAPLFKNKVEDMALLQTFAETLAQSEENEALLNEVEELSVRDQLTGLYNRRYFESKLQEELHRSERLKSPLSMLMIDIDNFKVFNNEYGHKMGDKVLRRVAEAIGKNVREIDTVARYGGEEIIVILPGTNNKGCDAIATAERIRTAIEKMELQVVDTTTNVTVSIGVSIASPEEAKKNIKEIAAGTEIEATSLVTKADDMLYEAKRRGRNQTRGPELPAKIDHAIISP